jgi:flagellar motor switch protein FliM
MRLRDLLQLKVGDTILLDTPVNGKIDLLAENRVKFRGKPAIRNRRLVVAITNVVSEE